MEFNSYEDVIDGIDGENLDIYNNVLLPVLTGQSLIHIRTHEEDRLKDLCENISDEISHSFRALHILTEAGVETDILGDSDEQDTVSNLALAEQQADQHTSLHVRALTSFLSNDEGGILLVLGADNVCRQHEFIRRLKNHANNGLFYDNGFSNEEVIGPKLVILHTISQETPETLSRTIQNYDLPLPRDDILSAALDAEMADRDMQTMDQEIREDWIRAMRGLTSIEAERSITQTFTVHNNNVSEESLQYLQSVKRNIIKQTGIMDFHEPSTSFHDIGGLENLVEDLVVRRGEFEVEAREAGIQSPKGCLLVGLPGTGKSLIAQSVAGEWHLPMLEFNMANVLDSFVGSSEQNIKKVLAVAESMAPCVLMVDEIDKALSGLGNSGSDSGTTRRVIGSFLTWLNDRKADVYVIATANDLREIASAMPEMLRKGRWDDIWWVDVPDIDTRKKIIEIHLKKIPKERVDDSTWNNLDSIAKLNDGITGAEIAAAVNEASRLAYHQNKTIDTNQLEESIKAIKPLAAGVKGLDQTRSWMKDFARPASAKEAPKVESTSEVYLSGLDASSQFVNTNNVLSDQQLLDLYNLLVNKK